MMLMRPLDQEAIDRLQGVFDAAARLGCQHWTSADEAMLLWQAAAVGPGPIVEIGSHCGVGTAILALAAPAGTRVFAVDPWDLNWQPEGPEGEGFLCLPDALDRARGLWRDLGLPAPAEVPYRSDTGDAQWAVPAEIGVLFLDGDHSTPGLLSDLDVYGTRVRPGGMIAFHDWNQSAWDVRGVARAWLAIQPDLWSIVGWSRSLYVWRREVPDGAE